MIRIPACLLFAVFLVGCMPTQNIVARQASTCDRMGYSRGTDAHSDCTMRLTMQERGARSRANAELSRRIAANQIPQPAMPRRTMVNCTHYPMAGTVVSNCY